MPLFAAPEVLGEDPPHYVYDASLMFRRMALNQIDQAEIAVKDPLLFFELQGVCTLCPSKERCVLDLAKEEDGDGCDGWHEYCPNATAFVALEMQQNCGLAGQHGAGDERVILTKLGRVILGTAKRATEKTYLEHRPEEFRFAPQQYFYAASKSGVVPSDVDRPTKCAGGTASTP
jgi:hypothetical protein